MKMKGMRANSPGLVIFLPVALAAAVCGCRNKGDDSKGSHPSRGPAAEGEIERQVEKEGLPPAPGPLALRSPKTPSVPLKSNPLETLRPFADRAVRGMTAQLQGGSIDEAYPDFEIDRGDENRLNAFSSVVDLAGFREVKGIVLGFDLFLLHRGRNVLLVKTSILFDAEQAAFADFGVERGLKQLPGMVYPLSAFTRGFVVFREAASELSTVLNSSSCSFLPVLEPSAARPWFPPKTAKQVGENLEKIKKSMEDSCALIATYEWDEVRVRPAELNFLVTDESGEPAGQIQSAFADRANKPAVKVQGQIRSFKPIGGR